MDSKEKQEKIIEKAREKLVEKLMDAMGKHEAERMASPPDPCSDVI